LSVGFRNAFILYGSFSAETHACGQDRRMKFPARKVMKANCYFCLMVMG
jgi:hypothetical protein